MTSISTTERVLEIAQASTDDLAEKLYERFRVIAGPATAPFAEPPWVDLTPTHRAHWEGMAQLARDLAMRTTVGALDWMIKAGDGDAEAAPYLPGMRYLAEIWRRVLAVPLAEVERFAAGPMPVVSDIGPRVPAAGELLTGTSLERFTATHQRAPGVGRHVGQPAPIANGMTPIVRLVLRDVADPLLRADLEQRAELGRDRYGVYLQAHNGRDALRDAYEEALDLVMYLRQAAEESSDLERLVRIELGASAIQLAIRLRHRISWREEQEASK